jgi:hypothetical protein
MREDAMIANERTKIATVRTGLVALRDKFIVEGVTFFGSTTDTIHLVKVEWMPGESYWVTYNPYIPNSICDPADPKLTYATSPSCVSKAGFPGALNVQSPDSMMTYARITAAGVAPGPGRPGGVILNPNPVSIENGSRYGSVRDMLRPQETAVSYGTNAPEPYTPKHKFPPWTLAMFLPYHERENVRAGTLDVFDYNGIMTYAQANARLPELTSLNYYYGYILGEATMNITDPTKELCRGKAWQYDPADGSIKLVGECLDN